MLHQVSSNHSSVTIVAGGYYKIGDLVIVDITMSVSSSITSGSVNAVTGLPHGHGSNHALLASDGYFNIVGCRVWNNDIYFLGDSLIGGRAYYISGVYLSY